MRAIVIDEPGDESVLKLGDAPVPELGPGDLRIRVAASGVNRADLLQYMLQLKLVFTNHLGQKEEIRGIWEDTVP